MCPVDDTGPVSAKAWLGRFHKGGASWKECTRPPLFILHPPVTEVCVTKKSLLGSPFLTQVPSLCTGLSSSALVVIISTRGRAAHTQGSPPQPTEPQMSKSLRPWEGEAGNIRSGGRRMALLSWQHCALAFCQQAGLDISAGRAPSQPVLAAPPPDGE